MTFPYQLQQRVDVLKHIVRIHKINGAIGQPEDIAAAVCFLASAEARFVNGTTLIVDGARLDIL